MLRALVASVKQALVALINDLKLVPRD
jgi:hypothetical protein